MSFARWENMEQCSLEMQGLGHHSDKALKICRAIKQRSDSGMLLKAEPLSLQVLSKAGSDEIVLAGYASWDMPDDEGDVFTVEAQVKALQRFFNQAPEYQNITVNHGLGWAKEFKLAQPMLSYVDGNGVEYFSHVNEKGTFLVVKVRPSDGLKATEYYRVKAKAGELNGFSVTALPLVRDPTDSKRVLDMEYHAITVTEKGLFKPVNPMTRDVKVVSKSVDSKQVDKTHLDEQARGNILKSVEKASVEDIEKQLLDKYRERSSLERLLSSLPTEEKVSVDSEISVEKPASVDPAVEAVAEEYRNKRKILNIEIWALEDALREKVLAVNKAKEKATAPTSVSFSLEAEDILAKYGFTHCRSTK